MVAASIVFRFSSLILLFWSTQSVDSLNGTVSNLTQCVNAIQDIVSYDVLSIVNSASTSMTNITAYASDIGNYFLCSGESLQHCLAGSEAQIGSTSLSASVGLNPFAGICVPTACGPLELQNATLFEEIDNMINFMVSVNSNYSRDLSDHESLLHSTGQLRFSYLVKVSSVLAYANQSMAGYTCGANEVGMSLDRYIFLAILWILISLMVLSTFYHMSVSVNNRDEANNPWILPEWLSKGDSPVFSTLINAFSLVKNVPFIFDVSSADGSVGDRIPALDGLRVISILWIILGHVLALYTSPGLTNPWAVFPPSGFLTQLLPQAFLSARFGVDTFFVLSAFLVIWSLLKKMDTQGSDENKRSSPPASVWIPMLYFHRVLRLLPLYSFCLIIWWKIGVIMGSGPLWYQWTYYNNQCNEYWWTNLLFVNNLIPYDYTDTQECFYVSWYLADDMQFFLLSPLYVLIFLQSEALGIISAVLTVVFSSIAAFVGTYQNDWSANSFDGLWVTVYTEEVYTKPQYRISAYAVGILGAMLWHMKQKYRPDFRLNVWLARGIMAASVTAILVLIFGSSSAYQLAPCGYFTASTPADECGSNWSLTARALYVGFTRPIWALAISAIILLSGLDQGERVQSFLSHPVWAPAAKLTFAVYLLHVTILNIWMFGRASKGSYTTFDFTMCYFAVVFVSFSCALFVTVMVESPCAKFAKVIETAMRGAFYGGGQKNKKASSGAGEGGLELKPKVNKTPGNAESSRLINK